MKLLITGGGGFVGARLARTLLARGTLAGHPLTALVLADQIAPPADLLADGRVSARVGPLLDQCAALPTRPSTASSTWPRPCPANARPTSNWACAPTWTARAHCSKRCARASSATAR
jgi:nucleoside-diphosphate-sugar epimerase